jgi:hypothetical protein
MIGGKPGWVDGDVMSWTLSLMALLGCFWVCFWVCFLWCLLA